MKTEVTELKENNRELATAIARDALAQLDAKRMRAQRMVYCYFNSRVESGRSLARQPEAVFGPGCKVCALGALFLGNLRFSSYSADYRACGMGPGHMRTDLSTAFTQKQLYLIEAAFEGFILVEGEGGEFYFPEFADDPNVTKRWAARFSSDERRLRAILSNIIDNGGEFILPRMKSLPTLDTKHYSTLVQTVRDIYGTLPSIPEGYEYIRFDNVNIGDYFISAGRVVGFPWGSLQLATKNHSPSPRIIVKPIVKPFRPRRWLVEDSLQYPFYKVIREVFPTEKI